MAQARNRFPNLLIDAPWKVTLLATFLSELAALLTVYWFSGFVPSYVPILVFICAFGTLYPINLLVFRLIRQNDVQRQQVQVLAQELQQANQQLTARHAILQARGDDLERQNQALNHFARTLAHDLKNLLAVVVQNNDLLVYYLDTQQGQPASGADRLLRAAHRSHDAALQMAKIVDAVLLLASVSAQPHAPQEPLAMATILAAAQKRLNPLFSNCGAEVTVAATWPSAVGYGPWVEEIWVNYLENAIRYGGQPPRIQITGEQLPNGFSRFWIADNGAGLTPEEQRLLFVEFTQLKRLDQSSYGLGLSIAKQITEKLGGEVGVESEVGQGSRFYFTLPTAPPPSA